MYPLRRRNTKGVWIGGTSVVSLCLFIRQWGEVLLCFKNLTNSLVMFLHSFVFLLKIYERRLHWGISSCKRSRTDIGCVGMEVLQIYVDMFWFLQRSSIFENGCDGNSVFIYDGQKCSRHTCVCVYAGCWRLLCWSCPGVFLNMSDFGMSFVCHATEADCVRCRRKMLPTNI